MKIIVLRHGETAYNNAKRIQGHIDAPLSTKGQKQAEKLAGKLIEHVSKEPVAVYSSDLQRAVQTAAPFIDLLKKRRRKFTFETTPVLREIFLGYIWQGKTKDQLINQKGKKGPSLFELWLKYPKNIIPPGAESMQAFYKRATGFIEDITIPPKKMPPFAVVFTHGGVVSILLNYVEGRGPGNFKRYGFSNASGPVLQSVRNGFVKVDEIGV